jgi:ABC-type glycerol-3-phosphate transport system substrate-binding protein
MVRLVLLLPGSQELQVAGKFDLARQPVGESGTIHSSWAGAHAFSIPKSSKNMEAAAARSVPDLTEIMYEEAKLGFLPTRDSVWKLGDRRRREVRQPARQEAAGNRPDRISNDFFTPPLIAEWIRSWLS